MRRKTSQTGSTTVAFVLAFILVAFTLITVYLFASKTWWFPPPITAFGVQIDQQFHRTLLIAGAVFVLAQLGLAFVIFRYRDHGQKVNFFEGNATMEFVWTLGTILMFVGLGLYGEHAWAEAHFQGEAPGALEVELTGQQFAWNVRYAGPDGRWGRLVPERVSASTGNPLGLDPADPAGKDDIVSGPQLYVPAGREVELLIRTQDVTHSFYVRELRLKQDAVPGMVIHMHFNATVPGEYEIACAELCGLGHYKMRGFLEVVSPADFEKWMKDQETALTQ